MDKLFYIIYIYIYMDHSEEYYKMKYLKYKFKYLQLKEKLEGGDILGSLVTGLGSGLGSLGTGLIKGVGSVVGAIGAPLVTALGVNALTKPSGSSSSSSSGSLFSSSGSDEVIKQIKENINKVTGLKDKIIKLKKKAFISGKQEINVTDFLKIIDNEIKTNKTDDKKLLQYIKDNHSKCKNISDVFNYSEAPCFVDLK